MSKGRRPRFHGQGANEAADPESFVERVMGFATVLADASSLIVLSDIGALAAAGRAWHLATIAAAAEEAGPASKGISLIDMESARASPVLSTDRALVEAARMRRLPLLSEDRKVLMAAEEAGLDCLDALLVLELLSARGSLTPEEYGNARTRLLDRNIYRGDRLSWAESVGAAAAKLF